MMRLLSSQREDAVVEDSSSILVNKEYNDDEESVKTRMTAMVVGRVGRRRSDGNNRRPNIATIAALTTGILLLLVLTIISTTSITTKDSGAVENNNHHDNMKRNNGLRDESQQQPPYTTHYDHYAKRATETLAHWHRSLSSSASSSSSSAGGYDMKGLRPLDLVLDDPTTVLLYDDGSTSGNGNTNEGSIRRTPLPKVYQRGDGGFLEPYDFNNYQSNEERIDVSYGLAHDDNTDVVEDDDDEEEETIVVVVPDEHVNDNTVTANHVMKERIGITNLDITHRGVHHTPLPRDLEEVNERRKLLNQEKNDRELLLVSSSSSSTTANLVLHWCGTSHEDAASKCGKHCRKGHGCPTGEFCFGVGNVCDWKLEEIEQKRLDKSKDKNEKEDEREEDEEKQKKSNKKDDDRDKEIEQDKKKMKQRTDTLKDRNSKKKQRDKEADDDNKSTKKKRIKSNDDDKSTKKKRIKSKNDDVDDKSPKNEQRIKSKNDNDSDSSLNAMGYVSANVNKDKDDDYNKKRGYEIINGNIHVDIQPVNRRRLRRRDVKNNNKDDEQDIVRLLKRREEEIFDFTHHDKTKKSYYESSSTAIVDTDTSPPVVRSTFPPSNTTIGPRQTFGALVSDHALSYTSGVQKVCVQFRDALGVRSTCLPLYNVGSGASSTTSESGATSDVKCTKAEHRLSVDCLSSSSLSSISRTGGSKSDIWERTFDGFGAFAGTAWKYRIQAYDTRKNRIVTKWQIFNIDARAEVTTTTTTTTTTSTIAAATTTTTSTIGSSTTNCGEGNVGNGICPMAGDCCSKWGYCGVTSDHCGRSSTPATKLVDVVMDENWPHGGVVQTSTGRILFFFDGNPYVCSGTVIKDPAADRTIVLTAGHCAYQYQPSGGRFTEHALFIPNQVDTRGVVSDELCTNDPLGCWVPAFAVVHYEWTTKGFPHSVPWDYAYYVIPNDVSAHLSGFIHENQKDLSRILEEIVEPLPIDFNWRLISSKTSHLKRPKGEFAHGLGYSFNRDPAFRYCASNTITKFGVPTYENLWLESCAMTGGSSGGPWLKDTDTDGRGTVISINSWGYATVPGMAGPDFSTASGSKAECLFEVAKNTPFEDVVGKRGIVVDNC